MKPRLNHVTSPSLNSNVVFLLFNSSTIDTMKKNKTINFIPKTSFLIKIQKKMQTGRESREKKVQTDRKHTKTPWL